MVSASAGGDATQNLVDDEITLSHGQSCAGCLLALGYARRATPRTWTFHERPGVSHTATIRPPVSPEQREAMRAVVGEQLTRAGLDLDGPPFADGGETQWPVALELRDRMADAILARFSLPALDVEEVARVIQIAANSSEDRSPGQTRAEWYAAALVAALRAGELTREEANE